MTTISHKKSFLIDPNANSSLDTTSLWTSTTGTVTVSSGDLLFNADAGMTKKWFVYGRFLFTLNIPEVPTAADVREWGLKSLGLGNKGRMSFNIVDDVFTADVYDADGTVIESHVLPFDATWEDADVDFVIDWKPGMVSFGFAANGTRPVIAWTCKSGKIFSGPLSIYINNANSDNLLLDCITVDGSDDIGTYN